MTCSLNTLNADSEGRGPSGLVRFVQDSSLLLAAAGLLFWLIAMLSHNLADPAWSTSGSLGVTHNWGGRFGAWLSDLNFTLFGLSAWWLLLAALRAWLAALAVSLRGAAPKAEPAVSWPRRLWRQLGPWSGFLLLMGASCALEWAWLYRFDPVLPAGAGGALGHQRGLAVGQHDQPAGALQAALHDTGSRAFLRERLRGQRRRRGWGRRRCRSELGLGGERLRLRRVESGATCAGKQ